MPGFHCASSVNVTGNVSPDLLASVYGISQPASLNPGANQAVFEALGQNYEPLDLLEFESQYKLPTKAIAKVIGPNTPLTCVLLAPTLVGAFVS